jgi:hypothetical protein
MERETEKPQYEQDYSDSPKHGFHGKLGAAILIKFLLPLTSLLKVILCYCDPSQCPDKMLKAGVRVVLLTIWLPCVIIRQLNF